MSDKTEPEESQDFEEEDEGDSGISFERYAEMCAKMHSLGEDEAARTKFILGQGYSMEDWDFYESVWRVEMAEPERMRQFMELYARYMED